MTRRIVLLVAVLLALCQAASIRALAHDEPDAIPLAGVVVDASGVPVIGARVSLIRVTHGFNGGTGYKNLASDETGGFGTFSFGPVQVNTAVSFPLESGVDLEYRVWTDGQARQISGIDFTAPRQNGAIASVEAKIRIK